MSETGDRETQLSSQKEASGQLTAEEPFAGIVFPKMALSDCPVEFPGEVYLVEIK